MIELCCEYLSVQCNWLYVLVMSRTRFKVNPSYGDLKIINDWACKWKMSFNPDSTKLAHDVFFSRKKKFTTHRFYLITFLLSAFNLTDI